MIYKRGIKEFFFSSKLPCLAYQTNVLANKTKMGGHAHGMSLIRLLPSQHEAICNEIITAINTVYPAACATLIPPAPEKEDHGDVDLILKQPLTDMELSAIGLFDKCNRHSYLYLWNGILAQVDLEVVQSNFSLAIFLKSFGLVGHICGIYAKWLGCHLYHGGLFRVVYLDGDRYLFLISDDLETICEAYFHLDYQKWKAGFKTQDDLFAWLDPICPPISRIKPFGTKRPIFKNYVSWIQSKPAQVSNDDRHFQLFQKQLQQSGMDVEIDRQIEETNQEHQQEKLFKQRVNGRTVQEILNHHQISLPQGPCFGKLMQTLLQIIDEADCETNKAFPSIPSEEELDAFVLKAFELTKNQQQQKSESSVPKTM